MAFVVDAVVAAGYLIASLFKALLTTRMMRKVMTPLPAYAAGLVFSHCCPRAMNRSNDYISCILRLV